VDTDGELRAEFGDGSTLRLRAAWASDVAVDTTRISVRGRDRTGRVAAVTLETTFGFSPQRVAEPTLEIQLGDRANRIAVPATIGVEYDRQVTAAVTLIDQGGTDPAELRRSTWVLGLLESAYRVAGRPLWSAMTDPSEIPHVPAPTRV
jgi:oxidoreductase